MSDDFAWLTEVLGLTEDEARDAVTQARGRVAAGDLPDVRLLSEDGDPNTDIAASRLRDMRSRGDVLK